MFARLRGNRGGALLEFTIVFMMLLALLLGIVEFGMLFKDNIDIAQAAREGARVAAVGGTTTSITETILQRSTAIGLSAEDVILEKGGPDTWTTLGNADGKNNASQGEAIRVRIIFDHQWVTGFFSASPTKEIQAQVIMRRE